MALRIDWLIEIQSFTFNEGEEASVEISNEGTDGHVIVDVVQWLPVQSK